MTNRAVPDFERMIGSKLDLAVHFVSDLKGTRP
jgi:hypothetical protein